MFTARKGAHANVGRRKQREGCAVSAHLGSAVGGVGVASTKGGQRGDRTQCRPSTGQGQSEGSEPGPEREQPVTDTVALGVGVVTSCVRSPPGLSVLGQGPGA